MTLEQLQPKCLQLGVLAANMKLQVRARKCYSEWNNAKKTQFSGNVVGRLLD